MGTWIIKLDFNVIATARAGNVIGGGDWAKNRIIPDAVRSLSKGKDIEIRSPNSKRPWQHVLEPFKRIFDACRKSIKEFNM